MLVTAFALAMWDQGRAARRWERTSGVTQRARRGSNISYRYGVSGVSYSSDTITLGQALAFGAILFLGLLLALVVALWRSARARTLAAAEAADHARDAETRMAGILQSQAEMQGRMGAIRPW